MPHLLQGPAVPRQTPLYLSRLIFREVTGNKGEGQFGANKMSEAGLP
jgi:hypothetical protein